MTDDRWMRASDQDRESAVEVLREAYAAGRLRPEEFYQRVDAAYEAMTWGELDSLTADLPLVWTSRENGAVLPADTVAPRSGSPAVNRLLVVHAMWMFLIVLVAGLAGRVTSVAVWAACVLLPLMLVLPAALGRTGPERRGDARRHELPGPRGGCWRHQDISLYDNTRG